jgi:hypothetical protein
MPFTPFHIGPAVLFGVVLFRRLDFPTVLVASVIVDLRATLIFVGAFSGRLHGPLHTFVGGTALALGCAIGVYSVSPALNRLCAPLGLAQSRTWRTIVPAALGGVWVHIVLDAILYTDIQPFVPAAINPLYGLLSVGTVYGLCIVAFGAGVSLWWHPSLSPVQSQ